MKAPGFIVLVVVGLGLAFVLRPARPAAGAPAGTPAEEAWSFKQGQGITLGGKARTALGLVVVPVGAADITVEHAGVSAQVYRAASESPDRAMAEASLWLPVTDAKLLMKGQKLDLERGESRFSARIASIKPALNASGNQSELLLAIVDAKAELRVGDFLRAHFGEKGGGRLAVTVVPAEAVVASVRGDFVYVVNGPAFLRTPVKLGPRQGDRVEVVDGLFEGDEIVATGAAGLWMVELQAVNGGKGCADGH